MLLFLCISPTLHDRYNVHRDFICLSLSFVIRINYHFSLITVPVPSQESKQSCICMIVVSILSLSTIFQWNLGNVLTAWYFWFLILFLRHHYRTNIDKLGNVPCIIKFSFFFYLHVYGSKIQDGHHHKSIGSSGIMSFFKPQNHLKQCIVPY